MKHTIITIGREYGSGGHEVGAQVAKELGIKLFDKELIKSVAEASGFAESYVKNNEEVAPVLNISLYGTSFAHCYQQSPTDIIYLNNRKVIQQIAEKQSCVIVGRSADFVLKDTGCISIFIYADMESRITRRLKLLKENEGKEISRNDMHKHIRYVDKQRSKYYDHYTDLEWGDVHNYDFCINTSKTSIATAAELILAYTRKK